MLNAKTLVAKVSIRLVRSAVLKVVLNSKAASSNPLSNLRNSRVASSSKPLSNLRNSKVASSSNPLSNLRNSRVASSSKPLLTTAKHTLTRTLNLLNSKVASSNSKLPTTYLTIR